MDPASFALAFANTAGGARLLGGVGGGIASPTPAAGPSRADQAVYGNGLDASGWNVNFSGVQDVTQSQDKSGGVPGLGITGGVGAVPWWAWAILAGAVLWKLKQSRR
jgi:hypothetical protein